MGMLTALRRSVGAFIGGFEGGLSARRLKGFHASRAHVNTLIQASGNDMTARARYLIRNNGYAVNAVESFCGNMVGTGIKPSSGIVDARLKDDVQKLWLRWTDESDAEGLTDFYGSSAGPRESFSLPERSSSGSGQGCRPMVCPCRFSCRCCLRRCCLCTTTGFCRAAMWCGRELSLTASGGGSPTIFTNGIRSDHTEPQINGEQVRVPAASVLHIIDPVEAGQLRGFSRYAPVLVKLFILDQYDDAELDRKKVAAMFVGFVRRPAGEDLDREHGAGEDLLPLEPGQLQILDDGEDITFSAPSDVGGNYEAFQYRTLLQVAAGLGLPYANLTSDMLKANYSNTRAALLEFRRRVEAFQHSVLVFQLCRPVWTRWMDAAALSGALHIPGYEKDRTSMLTCAWLPPRWDWVDPQKDIRAEIMALNAGLKSRSQAISERGYDAAAVDAEIAGDKQREKELGILNADPDKHSPGSFPRTE